MNLQTLTHQKRRDMDFTDRPTKTWIQPGYTWLVNARSQYTRETPLTTIPL